MQRPVTQTHTHIHITHFISWSLLYSVIFCSRADLLRSCYTQFWLSDCSLSQRIFKHPPKWCTNSTIWFLHGWCHVHHIPCTSVQCHFNWSHTCRVHVSLAVICRLHFWQNNQDLLRATAVTRGWSSCQNKSECRKLTLEQKILSPFLLGLKPTTFWSQVWHSTTQLFPPTPNHHPLCPVQSTVTRNNFQGIYSIKVVYEHIYQIK